MKSYVKHFLVSLALLLGLAVYGSNEGNGGTFSLGFHYSPGNFSNGLKVSSTNGAPQMMSDHPEVPGTASSAGAFNWVWKSIAWGGNPPPNYMGNGFINLGGDWFGGVTVATTGDMPPSPYYQTTGESAYFYAQFADVTGYVPGGMGFASVLWNGNLLTNGTLWAPEGAVGGDFILNYNGWGTNNDYQWGIPNASFTVLGWNGGSGVLPYGLSSVFIPDPMVGTPHEINLIHNNNKYFGEPDYSRFEQLRIEQDSEAPYHFKLMPGLPENLFNMTTPEPFDNGVTKWGYSPSSPYPELFRIRGGAVGTVGQPMAGCYQVVGSGGLAYLVSCPINEGDTSLDGVFRAARPGDQVWKYTPGGTVSATRGTSGWDNYITCGPGEAVFYKNNDTDGNDRKFDWAADHGAQTLSITFPAGERRDFGTIAGVVGTISRIGIVGADGDRCSAYENGVWHVWFYSDEDGGWEDDSGMCEPYIYAGEGFAYERAYANGDLTWTVTIDDPDDGP